MDTLSASDNAGPEHSEPGHSESAQPLIEVRDSKVHGKGVFALRQIVKGTRIIEYLGERVSHQEADRRYEDKDANDSHTFLFIVDSRTVIDAGVDGNDARFFNHSCDPNCESVIENKRVYIEAVRTIEPGQEMTYDYGIQREPEDPPNIDEIFACRCGFEKCKGTMLSPADPPKKRKAAARKKPKSTAKPAKDSVAARTSGGKSAGKSAKKSTGKSAGKSAAKSKPAPRKKGSSKTSGKKSARRRR
jgi:hypothetical protein